MALSGARYKLISRICNPALLSYHANMVRKYGANVVHGQAAEGQLFFDEVHAAAAATTSPAKLPTAKSRTAVVLHGLLGSGRNLRSLAQDLCRQAAAATGQPWRALLVDLRCHGRSASAAGLPPPNDLQSTALDVVRLLQRQLEGSAPEALIGHSLGGKTALEVVRQLALPGQTPQPKAVWVLDARPTAMLGNPDGATRDVQHVLESVRGIQVPLASREELYRLLREQGFSNSEWLVCGATARPAPLPVPMPRPLSTGPNCLAPPPACLPTPPPTGCGFTPALPAGLQQWLGSSLVRDGDGRLTWQFNVEGAAAMFAE
jgi:pimeloyl-ACP methyl ester carboxylesterase